MRVINLCHGAGDGVSSACLLTASNMVMGRGEFLDENDCVCQILRDFIVETNDSMPLDILGRIYTPLIWEIIGTKTNNKKILKRRARKLIDMCFDLHHKYIKEIDKPKRINRKTIEKFKKNDYSVDLYGMLVAYGWRDYTECGQHAANFIQYIYCYTRKKDNKIWEECPKIIREIAKIGDKRPIETVITHDQLADSLCG